MSESLKPKDSVGAKIIEGLAEAILGDLSSVTINGQTWVRQPASDTPDPRYQPVAWWSKAANGNTRCWTSDPEKARRWQDAGIELQPLFSAPSQPDPRDEVIAEMREALRFYADVKNHGHYRAVEGDNGCRARAALSKGEGADVL